MLIVQVLSFRLVLVMLLGIRVGRRFWCRVKVSMAVVSWMYLMAFDLLQMMYFVWLYKQVPKRYRLNLMLSLVAY